MICDMVSIEEKIYPTGMRTLYKTLKKEELQLLLPHCEVLHFPLEFSLIYENQIPIIGIVLVKGEIELRKNSTLVERISHPALLAWSQFLDQKPLRQECVVMERSEVLLIGKADVLSLRRMDPQMEQVLSD